MEKYSYIYYFSNIILLYIFVIFIKKKSKKVYNYYHFYIIIVSVYDINGSLYTLISLELYSYFFTYYLYKNR